MDFQAAAYYDQREAVGHLFIRVRRDDPAEEDSSSRNEKMNQAIASYRKC